MFLLLYIIRPREPVMTVDSEIRAYQLISFLEELKIKGFAIIHLRALYRLLDKRSRAAGTWHSLLQFAVAECEYKENEIKIAEIPGEILLLTTAKVEPLTTWAGR